MNAIFRFKQFSIQQQKSAAKVGTDSVLIGSWSPIPALCKSVLDVGTGTGVIALMIAQRTDFAKITAIEKDKEAFVEAQLNFKNSFWSTRLFANNISFEKFNTEQKFDLIISNPPFYRENYDASNPRRFNARNMESLSFGSLISKSSQFLSKNGIFSVIIPYKEKEIFLELAAENDLFPCKILNVRGNPNAPFKRILIAFQKTFQKIEIQNLTIENQRHQYTDEYTLLTRDFYLKM